MASLSKAPQKFILRLLVGYRWLISPWFGNCCRFYPSCSHYATQAITKYGMMKGGVLVLKRVLKCHPWHPGGLDEVP